MTGFVGPNGAGKSTTMRAILGLDAADEGAALIGGCSTSSVDAELWINRITPLAGLSIQQTRERFDYALGPWQGLAVLCAWAAAALALAWWSLRRRDA